MPTPPLPRIACFHGGGSKSTIYQVQCAHLSKLLENDFQLIFFDGPFTRDAGPGILPAFRGQEPYKSWFTKDDTGTELGDGSGYDTTGRDGVERVWKMMEEEDRQQAAQGRAVGPWVAAMGFSQGTRMVGGLLLDQQRRMETAWEGEKVRAKLRFGVLCNGSGAPMESEIANHINFENEVVKIPTVHVHGTKDIVLPLSRHQYDTFYDSESRILYEIDYHHAMPWVKEEVEQLASLIRQTYKENL
ncbi:hypothetical protein BO70DRAFT_300112 [Aspergillus heteromorphus CBS 117.55]|uniref:Serine hydrolase domain-containing protein n=1 Tax=Aspergillus heteromorphus CBS 117.55 TaxID=1448321 RepID=A0A317V517_9EURO|nr:uncharacterized protein BO70DRAFT_300112 [Aspergillus heteromorphus CBS 117.55]PWY69086.1 hypothetical protein BO70DRAFT_300112 [Aspergillus heteromorphus CBS 117.55]